MQPFAPLKSIKGERAIKHLVRQIKPERKINMNKKLIISLLAATMTVSTSAFATEAINVSQPEVIATLESASSLKALVTAAEIGDDYIVVKSDEGREIQLNISENTVIIDSETANAFSAKDIKAEDELFVQYSSVMTRSIPPQTNAEFIAVNVDKGSANLINVDSVSNDEEGNLLVTDNSANIVLTIAKDASVTPYMTKNIVRAADIVPGTKIVAWYDMVTMSIPAYANTDKVVLIPEAVVSEEVDGEFKILVGDKEVDIAGLPTAPYYDESTLMVPLRKIGEALGYNVGWDDASCVITIGNNTLEAQLKENSATVSLKSAARAANEVGNAKATVVKDGHTYVPLDFFKVFSNDVAVEGNVISVSPIAVLELN